MICLKRKLFIEKKKFGRAGGCKGSRRVGFFVVIRSHCANGLHNMKGSGVKAFISGNEKDLPVLQNQLGGGVCLAHNEEKGFLPPRDKRFRVIQNKGAVVIWQTDTVGFKEEMRGNSCKTDKIFQRNMMFGIAIRYHADRGL